MARLVALEKRPHAQHASTPYCSPFPSLNESDSFSYMSNHHLPIPPPPSHSPPRFFTSQENQTPSTTRAVHGNAYGGVPPRRFILGDSFDRETTTVPYQHRVPFRSIQPSQQQPGHGDQNQQTVLADPVRAKPGSTPLPSSVIDKHKLATVNDVLMKHPKLRCASKIGTLAVKLAREAVFGDDVMAQCTVAGERGLPGLPTKELQQLKQALFMQFPVAPQEFEALWKTSTAAVGQACKRLRSKNVPSLENI